MKQYLCLIFILTCLFSCVKPEEFPDEPVLTSASFDKASINNFSEGFTLTISFQDGDGNIGTTEEFPEANAFVLDTRTGFVDSFFLKNLEPSGNIKDISGTIDLSFTSECCIAISGISCSPQAEYPPSEEVIYEVSIQDRAGNLSNAIQTPPLTIICK